jgi:hypothetical protein
MQLAGLLYGSRPHRFVGFPRPEVLGPEATEGLLLDQFKHKGLADPTDPQHGIDLEAMATELVRTYKREKAESQESGASGSRALPGVHHPVFRSKPVNYHPCERFIAEVMAERGDYDIFHHFYRALVQALYEGGASPSVFGVNFDAAIAALLLALLWKDHKSGALSERELETAAFTVFLYGRMIGCAAAIEDHLNRGRNMDPRTPAAQCSSVC